MRLHAEKAGLNGAAVKRTCFAAHSFGRAADLEAGGVRPLKGRCAKKKRMKKDRSDRNGLSL